MSRNPASGDHQPPPSVWNAPRFGHPTADELFTALDGRPFTFFNTTWRLKIYSIYDDGETRWLQVRMDGRPPHSTTLRVAVGASPDDVVAALTTWLIESRPSPRRAPYVH